MDSLGDNSSISRFLQAVPGSESDLKVTVEFSRSVSFWCKAPSCPSLIGKVVVVYSGRTSFWLAQQHGGGEDSMSFQFKF